MFLRVKLQLYIRFLVHLMYLSYSLNLTVVPGGGGETPSPVEVLEDGGGGKNEVSPGKRWPAAIGGMAGCGGGGGRNGGLVTVGFSKESMQNDLL